MRFRFGEFELDDRRFTLTGPAGPVHVEPQVFGLLRHLIANRDRVVSKEELLDAVWGDRFVSESALTSRVKAARRAIDDDGRAQRAIRTAHGRGYQFVADVQPEGGDVRRAVPRLRGSPVGRDEDIAGVVERLREPGLVTVTGPAGMGKTTLALAVAELVGADYADGVVFVDLTPVPPGGDVTRAVADAAGVEGSASESLSLIADNLANRRVLLVLDNCEHVLGDAAALAELIGGLGEKADILATSREPLGVVEEHVWPLGPLHEAGPVLFVERARAAEPRVRWEADDPAVVELCRRLDGVPLALELAAGQLRRFDLDELRRRLDDRLALLGGRASGHSPRHATMETAIDWSYRLLDPGEQALLRHLGVFPASFDLRAVEGIAPLLPGRETDVTFGQLVDKSLVVRLPGQGRYRLLETIRVFARHRLDDAGEYRAAAERHRRYVLERFASAPRLDRWMSARLGAELRGNLDDVREAFCLSLDRGRDADALEIAVGVSFLWRNAIGGAEGAVWLDRLSALPLPPLDELWVAILRADLGMGRGDHRQMFAGAAAAQERMEPAADPAGSCLAAYYGAIGELTAAGQGRGRLEAALDLARRAGDARLINLIEAFLALADLFAGQDDRAREAVQRIDRIASEDGYDRFITHWAGWLLALAGRDAAAARRWITRQHEFLGRTGIVENWLSSLSTAMCDVIDGEDPTPELGRALALALREGYAAEADCVLVLAFAEVVAGRFEAAAELVGTARHGRFNATGHHVLYRAVLDRALHDGLDERRRAAALARGRDRTPADALAEHGITAATAATGRATPACRVTCPPT